MFGNIKRKQNPSSDGRESVKLFGCQNSQYVKVDVCRFHYLKNGLSLSRFSFLLFCRLLVLWQKIVASFLGHVACLFYPLEGLTIQHHTLRNELDRPLTAGVVPSASGCNKLAYYALLGITPQLPIHTRIWK